MINSVTARLSALVPFLSSDLSPVLVYVPQGNSQVAGSGTTVSDYGWTAPDLNSGEPYTVQVECYGAGGGGGGGSTGLGGGGGAGGEYACEPEYPIIPFETYSYYAGGNVEGGNAGNTATSTGDNLLPGGTGTDTHFDSRGKGITGGVVAHGGQGGDAQGIGTGGRGGTGSSNTIHFDGGDGASSTSGVASDNPGLGLISGTSVTKLSWRLDDKPGTSVAFDYATGRHNSSSIQKNPGAIVQPTTEIAVPVQIPFGASADWDRDNANEVAGACWKFSRGTSSGYIGGIVAPSFSLASASLTVSCWIKGASDAVGPTDWGDSNKGVKVLAGNCDITQTNTNGIGFCLYLNLDTSEVRFRVQTGSGGTTNACAMPSASDGNWHMVTASFTPGVNGMNMYVDGVLLNTITSAFASVPAGAQPLVAGMNKPTLSASFRGYMSNLWVATTAVPLSYVQFAYGNGSATGGSGGGASGGSAGMGNAGTAAVGAGSGAGGASTAASDPGINNGSASGGAGGAAGASGADANLTGPPTGGGGGGAGNDATVTPTYTASLTANMSGSYTGFDADGMGGGQLYTISASSQVSLASPWYSAAAQGDSTAYSGGRADSPFQGSMFSILTFPSFAAVNGSAPGSAPIPLNDSRWAIDALYLKLTIHTENAANLEITPWYANTVLASLPSTKTLLTAAGLGSTAMTAYVPAGDAGRQVTIDLFDANLGSSFVTKALSNGFGSAGVGLVIGQLKGTDPADPLTGVTAFGAWDSDEAEDWNCVFTGADQDPAVTATLAVKYHAAATSLNQGGKGSPGYVAVTFINPKGVPVTTILPAAATDDGGNQLDAGVTTTRISTWTPGSSPKTLEGWHNLTGMTAGSGYTVNTARYRLAPDGKHVEFDFHFTAGASPVDGAYTFTTTLSSAYQPAGNRRIQAPLAFNATAYQTAHWPPMVEVWGAGTGSPGRVDARLAAGYANGTDFSFSGMLPLD
jgi:hypothetical protein